MKAYKSLVTIGKEDKVVVAVNWKQDEQEVKEATVDRLHHIHVLDRSYSMSGHLRQLIENVKETHTAMADNDLISVVWFSGEGQGDILLKGASKSQDVDTLLDTIKHPVGTTCFSEPLAKVNTIIDDLSAICSNFSVTFFTDGETVTRHSEQEEEQRIFAQLGNMKDRIMAFNTIGYGYYYNQDLLQRMADTSMFGKMIHSSQINDYKDIWTHTYSVLADMVMEKVVVDTTRDTKAEVLYLSSKTTKLGEGFMELGFLDKTKNQFFIVLDPSAKSFFFNDKEYAVDDIKGKVPTPTLKNFFYALAYEFYYAGRTDEALDILAYNVKDKYAVDTHLKSFTADERATFQKELRNFIFKNKTRLKDGEAPEGYVPSDDAFSVMDLLKLLAKGDNYYVPVKDYNRIGLKVTDEFNLFKANENEEVKAPFDEFVFNQQHLNLSIRYMVNGKVKLNPIQAKQVGLDTEVDSRIYRNQTIIKDGNLNVPKFFAYIGIGTHAIISQLIKDGKAPEGLMRNIGTAQGLMVEFDLTTIPVINRQYSKKSDGIDTVKEVVEKIENLKAQQKVYKFYLGKQTVVNPAEKAFQTNDFTTDQIDVLKQHGLNSKLDYQGIDNKTAEKNEDDFYLSRALEMKLKGWSSLPKVDDVITKVRNNAKLNDPGKAMADAIETVQGNAWNIPAPESKRELERVLGEVKSELFDLNVELNTLKMAKVLTGGWWNGLEVDSKGNYTYGNLIIKSDRVKKFF
jgi:hypothetical protein